MGARTWTVLGAVAALIGFGLWVLPWRSQGEAPARCDRVASPDGALSTPQALLDALAPGATGCFRAGTYGSAREAIDLRARGVTLRSFPGERATLRGRVRVLPGADGATIEDLRLDLRNEGDSVGLLISADDVTVRGNEISNHRRPAICVHPRRPGPGEPDRFRILGNRILDCGGPPDNHRHGIYVADGVDGLIRDNVVLGSADRGIQLYPAARGTRVERNTLDGNGVGVAINDEEPGPDGRLSEGNVVEDNIITGSVIRWNVETPALDGTGNVVRGNCVFPAAGRAGFAAGGGIEPGVEQRVELRDNVVADPEYADRAAGDVRARNDACEDKGAPDDVARPWEGSGDGGR